MPLVWQTLALAAVFVLSTAMSIVPHISFWGSYQRLQGTYTTLSYMVVFALMLHDLRRHEQLRRVVTTIILSSIPVAFYGLLQHYGLDSLPWGGDVVSRVASNMGNAIFVAAYLIMVVPLTLARLLHLQAKALEGASPKWRLGFAVFFWFLLLVQTWAWSTKGFMPGLEAGLLAIVMLVLAGLYFRRPISRFVLLGCYSLVMASQLVCIFFSLSRGPWLGLLAGLFFFALLFTLVRRWRILTVAFVAMAAAVLSLLVVINLPRSPLARLRDLPYVGRLGSVLETEGGTGKVRVLIWEGTLDMLRANPARAVIGFGPESMYVAYNPYYPPDLAHYEARNASPDRSHNETFDAIVTTGFIGFVVYIVLFESLFYLGLSWLGLVQGRARKAFFFASSLGGAVLGVILSVALDHSWRFAGVGWPAGFVAGLALYVTVSALTGGGARAESVGGWRLLLLVALICAVVAHFVEIHFGIAIAVTRTYFWAYAALIVLLGQGLVSAEPAEAPAVTVEPAPRALGARTDPAPHQERRRKGSRHRALAPSTAPEPSRAAKPITAQVLAMAVIVGFILATMVWDYFVNPSGQSDPLAVIATSLTTMAAKGKADQISFGMAWLVLGVALIALLAGVSELTDQESAGASLSRWASALGTFALVSLGIGGFFALVHAVRIGPKLNLANLIYEYYVAVLLVWIAIALALWYSAPRRTLRGSGLGALGYLVLVVVCFLFIDAVNIRIVRADVLYKQGLKFDQESNWDAAIYFYTKAIELTPQEDYYLLFHGRALMERGKGEANAKARDAYFSEALASLSQARKYNPLNTDHTANVARLYRTWGELESDANLRTERLQRSLEYYAEAVKLSPHNAQLYNEWGLVYYIVGDLDQAEEKYQRSLQLDRQFLQTYILLGDVYLGRKQWQEAIPIYQRAVELNGAFVQGWSALGYAYSQLGQWTEAISANMKVLEVAPDDYSTLKNLAILYNESQRPTEALTYAQRALAVAPEQDKPTLETFVQQLGDKLGKE
jgi:tetratricopeptide (TPR) repeat protein/O-antigen ligase